ncbi:right-handed parallel beta-helix repeat-containing protein [Pseudooceanicola onchidii]|uniref:right-handed parallel beta-helix repeat-containing protein n=1 Tax=Pseudooceanicola onchidii TaxID=2562279 RepID=UPI0010AADE77|nr:right-handed parallel beta-helix repeat-containing protein [Pseudooceanicola onchidii]
MIRQIIAVCSLVAGLVLPVPGAGARDYWVVPAGVDAADSGEGIAASPFRSVKAALRSGRLRGGDRLILRDGFHGELVLNGYKLGKRPDFDPPLVIRSENPRAARFSHIELVHLSGLTLENLAVWPDGPFPLEAPPPLVSTAGNASRVRLEGLDLRAGEDAPRTYMSWTKEDWTQTRRMHGAFLRGADNAMIDSRVVGVAFGIQAMGDRAEIIGNQVEGFSGDALRGIGDNSRFIGNHVENCVQVDGNHADGFQSWASKGDYNGRKVVTDLQILRNVILEWTGPPSHPLRCSLQGIGLFDGYYRRPVIRDNLVAVSAYHGISLYGGVDGQILSNTVVHISGQPASQPWIMLGDKKNGLTNARNRVEGNIAMAYKFVPGPLRANSVIKFPARDFVDPSHFDYQLRPDSSLRQVPGFSPGEWRQR